MDNLGRLLLRLLLVPLGYAVAVVVGTLVIVFGSWKLGEAAAHADTQAFAIFGMRTRRLSRSSASCLPRRYYW